MSKNNVSKSTQKMVLLAILFAIIILVTCLPIKTLGLEITLAMIPIAVGAVLFGAKEGAILGGFYGVCSFLQCFGFLCPSPFGAQLLSINPWFTLIACIVPRILCGFLCGLFYKWLSKFDKTKFLSNAAACLLCPLLNTVFFMSAIMLLFGQTKYIRSFMDMLGVYNPLLFVLAFVGINGLIEAITNFVIATAVSKALQKFIIYN